MATACLPEFNWFLDFPTIKKDEETKKFEELFFTVGKTSEICFWVMGLVDLGGLTRMSCPGFLGESKVAFMVHVKWFFGG